MIYIVHRYWREKHGFVNDPDILTIGLVTTDKALAEKFCEDHKDDKVGSSKVAYPWTICECEDGEEYPL